MYQRHHLVEDHAQAVAQTALTPLHLLFQDQGNSISVAAILLGGPNGAALVDSIVDALDQSTEISRRTQRELRQLHDLLSLEHVHDATREEAFRFALIDPWDPVVEEICLLLENLREAMQCVSPASTHASLRVVS